MLRFVPIVLLFCAPLLGCKSIHSADIVGVWVVSDQSRQRFLSASQRSAAAKVTLDANGTFVASEVPEDLLYGPPVTGDSCLTGSGEWRLVSREGRQQVQLQFTSISTGQRAQTPYGTTLSISGGSGSKIRLYYFQGGDADQGRRIEFEKK